MAVFSIRITYALAIIIFAAILIALMFTDFYPSTDTISFSRKTTSAELWTTESRSYSYDVYEPRDAIFYSIMLEEDALSFTPCTDENLAASVKHSSQSVIGRENRTYDIGEEIHVLVKMYDGYGKRITSGGDQLRATIENKQLKASAPCVVSDNRNGTHSVTCEAFWSGTSSITVTLAYTRETITAHYRMRKQVLSTRIIYGLFKSGANQEDMACHPNQTELLKHTKYTELCNMTYINSGMSFYCGKPKNEHLLCQDWEKVQCHNPYPDLHLTGCENALMKRGQELLNERLYVNISVRNANNSRATVAKPSIPCSHYNLTLLWQSRRPTGYFYEGKWNLRNCIGFQQDQYGKCLTNRRLYLIGDSTIRAWYPFIIKRFKCQPTTEKWNKEKWHRMAECQNAELNFKAGWYPHAQPFFVGSAWNDVRYTLNSVSRHIDDVPENEHAIIVIHLYMHLLAFHHSVLRDRMQKIRQSIERLLARNKHSVIMIKGPHTFTNTPDGAVRLADYFGFVYGKIMYEIFDGLFHRVVLLNNKDSTIARHEKWNHPPEDIVNSMIDQMLSYVC